MVEHMSALSSSLYLALGALGATGLGAFFSPSSPSTDEPGQAVRAPAALVITSPRICAALEVYTLASENDWGLRTTIAQAVLNGFNDTGRVPDCAADEEYNLAREAWLGSPANHDEFQATRDAWKRRLEALARVKGGSA